VTINAPGRRDACLTCWAEKYRLAGRVGVGRKVMPDGEMIALARMAWSARRLACASMALTKATMPAKASAKIADVSHKLGRPARRKSTGAVKLNTTMSSATKSGGLAGGGPAIKGVSAVPGRSVKLLDVLRLGEEDKT